MNDDIQTRTGMNWRWFSIDPRRTLQQQWVFWWPIILLIGAAFGFAVPKFYWGWPDGDVYELILHNMRLPFLVASLALPVSVAIGRFHGAAQRQLANQIAETNQSFNHYFEHKKFFTEDLFMRYAYASKEYPYFEIADPTKFYEIAFPHNSMRENNYQSDYETAGKRAYKTVLFAFDCAWHRYQQYVDSWQRHPHLNGASTSGPKITDQEFYGHSLHILKGFIRELGFSLAKDFETELHKTLPKNVSIFDLALDTFTNALQISLSFHGSSADEFATAFRYRESEFNAEILRANPNFGRTITSELIQGNSRPGKAPRIG